MKTEMDRSEDVKQETEKLRANALCAKPSAENNAKLEQHSAASSQALSVDASTLKDSGAKMTLDEARVDNLKTRQEAYQASVASQSTVAFSDDLDAPAPTTAQAEPPRLSQDLSQLQRAQQMMAEFDANGQKPANDVEGPKVATAKGPTVSNS